jgi:phosphoribosylformylglycinamidine synthase
VKARVLIRPKEGILDPQGKAVERALPALGFEGIEHVRIGRLVELETDDLDALAALCEKLLANPLIEDFEIQPADSDAGLDESPSTRPAGPRDSDSAGSEAG